MDEPTPQDECSCLSCQAAKEWADDPRAEIFLAKAFESLVSPVGHTAKAADKSAITLLAFLGDQLVAAASDCAQIHNDLVDLNEEERQAHLDMLREQSEQDDDSE